MRMLGIETSCDETSVAVVEDGRRILANVVSSQARLHERFGGVVPEIACRAHLSTILPALDEALAGAKSRLPDCDGIAVTNRPGLIGPLLVGVTAAKSLALVHGLPIVPVDHLLAHLYALQMLDPAPFPQVALLVSGGHTELYRLDGPAAARLLSCTVDDAAGECFDKVAKILGLGYPGGPQVEQLAREGDAGAHDFPLPVVRGSGRFSFSGLKTAVLYRARGQDARAPSFARDAAGGLSRRDKAGLAASFQAAAVKGLVEALSRAAREHGARAVGICGGVAANGPLREAVSRAAKEGGWTLLLPPMALCTDNAAMVAGLGGALLAEGKAAPLDFDAYDSTT